MAEYYSTVQWAMPELVPSSLHPSRLGTELTMKLDPFGMAELSRAVNYMQSGQVCGPDQIPSEFWKALLTNEVASAHLLDFCNLCWLSQDLPNSWRTSTVVAIFKKGCDALPENYRPMSLLCWVQSPGHAVAPAHLHKTCRGKTATLSVWF